MGVRGGFADLAKKPEGGFEPKVLVFCAAANVGFAEVAMKVAVLAGIYSRTLEAEPNAFSMQGFQRGMFYGRRHFFAKQEEYSDWLEENHASVGELWVGYFRKSSGRPSLTWSESVDVALCFGWIDGVRKTIDERWSQEFGPVFKVDRLMRKTIQYEDTKEPFARFQSQGCA